MGLVLDLEANQVLRTAGQALRCAPYTGTPREVFFLRDALQFQRAPTGLAPQTEPAMLLLRPVPVAALGHEPMVHRGDDRRSPSGLEEGWTGKRFDSVRSAAPPPDSPGCSCTNAGQDQGSTFLFSGTWACAYQPPRELQTFGERAGTKSVGRPAGQVSGTPQGRTHALSSLQPLQGVSVSAVHTRPSARSAGRRELRSGERLRRHGWCAYHREHLRALCCERWQGRTGRTRR